MVFVFSHWSEVEGLAQCVHLGVQIAGVGRSVLLLMYKHPI